MSNSQSAVEQYISEHGVKHLTAFTTAKRRKPFYWLSKKRLDGRIDSRQISDNKKPFDRRNQRAFNKPNL